MKKKMREDINDQYHNEGGYITTDTTDIQRKIKEFYK